MSMKKACLILCMFGLFIAGCNNKAKYEKVPTAEELLPSLAEIAPLDETAESGEGFAYLDKGLDFFMIVKGKNWEYKRINDEVMFFQPPIETGNNVKIGVGSIYQTEKKQFNNGMKERFLLWIMSRFQIPFVPLAIMVDGCMNLHIMMESITWRLGITCGFAKRSFISWVYVR